MLHANNELRSLPLSRLGFPWTVVSLLSTYRFWPLAASPAKCFLESAVEKGRANPAFGFEENVASQSVFDGIVQMVGEWADVMFVWTMEKVYEPSQVVATGITISPSRGHDFSSMWRSTLAYSLFS